jgi:hypothetical protein
MNSQADVFELGPLDEARRLWRGAMEARQAPADDVVSLCESLDLGLHAAEILVIHLLQPAKDAFPATIQSQLSMPEPDVDLQRDGIHIPKVLQFADAIDLLSSEDLECVSPGLHRGWEDRRFSCRRSRVAAQDAIGVSLGAGDQECLLLLAAYRNRLFRCPPPVRVHPGEIRRAFESLERLMEGLLKVSGE